MELIDNPTHLFLSRLLVRSYRIVKTMNASFLESLGHHQVKIGHIMLMMNLSDDGSTSMELARRVQISKQAMSKLVNELAQKGFLEDDITALSLFNKEPCTLRHTVLKKRPDFLLCNDATLHLISAQRFGWMVLPGFCKSTIAFHFHSFYSFAKLVYHPPFV